MLPDIPDGGVDIFGCTAAVRERIIEVLWSVAFAIAIVVCKSPAGARPRLCGDGAAGLLLGALICFGLGVIGGYLWRTPHVKRQ